MSEPKIYAAVAATFFVIAVLMTALATHKASVLEKENTALKKAGWDHAYHYFVSIEEVDAACLAKHWW